MLDAYASILSLSIVAARHPRLSAYNLSRLPRR